MKKLILEEIGLNYNEALTYESLLKLGQITPPKLAKLINVSRENAYYILKSLEAKGLAEKIIKGKSISYKPQSPEKLKELLETEKQRFTEKEKAINAIIPELNNIYSLRSNKPSVAYFEGVKGIKQLYEDVFTVNKPSEVLVLRSPFDDDVVGYDFFPEDSKRLTLAGIKSRIISPKSAGEIFTHVGKLKVNREVKYVDDKELSIPAEICVYNNRVTFVSYRKDRIGAIIESKDLADSMREIFNYIWEKTE